MERDLKIVFGVDDSESSREAVKSAAALLKGRKDLWMTLYHGAPDPERSSLAKLLRLAPDAVEEHLRLFRMQKLKSLEQAKHVLLRAGLGEDKVEVRCDGKCVDPATEMLKLANSEGSEIIALARSRKPRPERVLLGSVTYRLVHLADEKAIWVIDAPIASNDVLVTLVGAPISGRVMDHAVRYFSHLHGSKFTFFHVIPPSPPIYWNDPLTLSKLKGEELEEEKARWLREYEQRVEEIVGEGKQRLLESGIPEENLVFKVQPATKGMAREILAELSWGNYGVVLIGRKGSKDISKFELGSIATKVLESACGCLICVVN